MSCTTDEAYAYFSGIAKDNDDYAGFPSWINMVINIPHGESLNEFDMSPITPRMIKNILKKRSSSSSSGEDGITYYHLKMLPSTHHLWQPFSLRSFSTCTLLHLLGVMLK